MNVLCKWGWHKWRTHWNWEDPDGAPEYRTCLICLAHERLEHNEWKRISPPS